MQTEASITDLLRAAGYGHRPAKGGNGTHEIFSFNTMEVVAIARAHEALAVVGVKA